MTKQVIVIRKDLNMRKGKIAAQAAHASMKVFFDRQRSADYTRRETIIGIELTPAMEDWVKGSFTKVVVYVNSEEELIRLYDKAREEQVPCALIVDAGRTEFHDVPTRTALAIGPAYDFEIDPITGDLPLL